tara:strand:- start:221 stop:511 length:291 start_codon:yes stop_codon:yes gene_type:complete
MTKSKIRTFGVEQNINIKTTNTPKRAIKLKESQPSVKEHKESCRSSQITHCHHLPAQKEDRQTHIPALHHTQEMTYVADMNQIGPLKEPNTSGMRR